MLKEKTKVILEKIKKSNFARWLKSKTIIKKLENKIGDLEKENKELIDLNRSLKLEIRKYNKYEKKTSEFKNEIKQLSILLANAQKQITELTDEKVELATKLFNTISEAAMYKIQCEEFEQQIENYKTEGRYLVKKVKPGRTPNTIKTKIAKPMASNVVKYMRDEHEQ